MRYLFLKVTIVLVEVIGLLALLAGLALVGLAIKTWDPHSGLQQAKLLLPDGQTLAFSQMPLIKAATLAPGVGAGLLGLLLLGMGQLCEAVLIVEKRVAPPPADD